MDQQFIIRLRSAEGQSRIIVQKRNTFGELLLQVSKKMNHPIKDIVISRQDKKPISLAQNVRIGDVPYFVDGAIINVDTKTLKKTVSGMTVSQLQFQKIDSKCNHSSGGRCINCLQIGLKSNDQSQIKKEKGEKQCSHGVGGKCLNCVVVDLKDKKGNAKMLCQHSINAKCVHCLDQEFISDAAHISFDNWLEERKLKCKGVHSNEVKCNNCLPPSKMQYEIDLNCKNHQPYPKAMCNKCIPPNVVVKRQEYRHVDYVQFMNISQIQDFIKYWLPRRHQQQRVAFLYGYYAQDPHYKGGIRVIVQALYQPLQKGTYGSFQILENDEHKQLRSVIDGLQLEKIGWIYTETNHDVVMSQNYVRMASQFQQRFKIPHQSGYEISNFITVILRQDEKNQNQVIPEVYMISDQGQALQRSKLFIEQQSNPRRKMQVKTKVNPTDAFPLFICGGKNVTEFEPEFLLVKIAHGSSKTKKFSILKKGQFPSFTRENPSKRELKQYLLKHKNLKNSWLKYCDFNLLICIAQQIDTHTAHSIAQSVASEKMIDQQIDDILLSIVDL